MSEKNEALVADYSLSSISLRQNTKPDARERLVKQGSECLSTQDLMMVLLGCGTVKVPVRKLAGKVLETIKNCACETIVQDLLKIRGIGMGKACLIAASLELGRRLNAGSGAKICSPLDILPFIQHYTLEKQEHFLCATLNGAHELLNIRMVSVGTLNRCIIHPREIYAEALKERAAAIILAHNHPSGNSEPSKNDVEITKQLHEASLILGIHLLDHIIISSSDYYSFVENRLVFSS